MKYLKDWFSVDYPIPAIMLLVIIVEFIAIVALAFLSGCTYDAGSVTPGQVFDCTDTRDGEKFTIHSENLGQVRGGIGADSCVSGFDDKGIPRQLCNASQTWLKCVKR